MPRQTFQKPIYVIVATTVTTTSAAATGSRALGIGLRNDLPWPSIKSDMAFFKNTTIKTRPAPATGHSSASTSVNAVIMGRKTWDSIPARFRPLAGRVNVVISRSASAVTPPSPIHGDVLHYPSLESALAALTNGDSRIIGNIFIMGGAQIYSAFLALPSKAIDHRPVRILQTQVRKAATSSRQSNSSSEFECDTFFPLPLELESDDANEGEWTRVDERQVQEEWLRTESGETVPLQQKQQQQQQQCEGEAGWLRDDKVGVEVRVVGWERRG